MEPDEDSYDVMLLKFVVSAIIDHHHNRAGLLRYVRANLEAFASLVESGQQGEFCKERIENLLNFLETGDRKPLLDGSPPELRLVPSDDAE